MADATLYAVLVNHRLTPAPALPPAGPPQPLAQSLGRSLGIADLCAPDSVGAADRTASVRALMLQLSQRRAARDVHAAELHAEIEAR